MTVIPERLVAALADRYRLERELGAGGMATVYLAEDLKHRRQVAVKVLRPDLAATLGADRFLREIGIAARLSHPHILPLHDSGEADGFLYYVMPYVEGTSLRQKLTREGELPIPEAVRILRDLADAMAYAHAQGIVHRDIKPENVMLTGRHAVVMDFGVAKALGEAQSSGASSLTSAGVALGTPAYMAPEQATGDAHVDARADLYAWGIVAYELLAGQPPFVRATPQNTLAAQVTATPEPVTAHRATVPGVLAALVMQCLEKRPADRPQTATELVTRLEAVLTPSGGMTPTDTRPYQTAAARRAKRHRWAMSGIAVAALVGIGAGALWYQARRFTPYRVESSRPLAQTTELEAMAAISPDGKLVAYSAGPPGRGDMKIFIRPVAGGSAVPLTADLPGHHQQAAWSPDGSLVYFTRSAGGQLSGWVVPYVGGTPRQVLPDSSRGLWNPHFTPDGKGLVYVTNRGKVVLSPLDGGAPSLLHQDSALSDARLAPDGKRLAYVMGQPSSRLAGSAIRVVTLPGGKPVTVTDTGAGRVSRDPVWTPDGQSLLYVSDAGGTSDLYQQRLAKSGEPTGAPVRLTTGADPLVPRISADGARMVYTVVRGSAPIWAAPITSGGVTPSSALRQVTRDLLTAAYIDVSPDGKWVAFDSDFRGNNDLYKVPAEGGEAVQLTRDPAPDFVPRWSPDGREIAYHALRGGNRDIRVITSDGLDDRAVTSDTTSEVQPDWSPDGRALAFVVRGEVLMLERDASGAWGGRRQLTPGDLGRKEGYHEGASLPCWMADGKGILYQTGSGVAADGMELRVVSPAGGAPRVLVRRGAVGSLTRHACGPESGTVYVTTRHEDSRYRFWAIPVSGGAPRLLLELDRLALGVSYLTTDGRTLFFTLPVEEVDVWVVEFRK